MISPYAYSALSKYKEKPVETLPGGELHRVEVFLLQNDYIEVDEIQPDSSGGFTALSYKITEEGLNALSEYEAEHKQQRFDNKVSVAQVLVPIVTFFLGVIFEYRTGILYFILHSVPK